MKEIIVVIINEIESEVQSMSDVIKEIYGEATILSFSCCAQAMAHLDKQIPNIAIIDIDQEQSTGIALAEKIHIENNHSNLIFVSNSNTFPQKILKLFPSGILVRPFDCGDVKKEFEHLRYS